MKKLFNINRFSNPSPTVIGLGIFSSIIGSVYFTKDKKPIQLESKINRTHHDYLTRINPQLAYEFRPTNELINNYLMLNLCNFYPILKFINPALDTLDKVKLSTPIYWLIKTTLFKHFCGGETTSELKGLIDKLDRHNIGCILNFTIESKLSDNELVSNDLIINTYAEGIELASKSNGDQLIAIKISGLLSSYLLKKISINIEKFKLNFKNFSNNNSNELNPNLTKSELYKLLLNYSELTEKDRMSLINEFKSNSIEYIDFFNTINPFNLKYYKLFQLNNEDLIQLKDLMIGLNKLGNLSKQYKIPILIDAEQSIFQPSIDFIYYELSNSYNQNLKTFNKPLIYQTYQMYLKQSHDKLKLDELIAEKRGLNWGVKLVRGAYIAFETENASSYGIDNPIHNDIEATHKSYNTALNILLKRVSTSSKLNNHPQMGIVIASHNINSVLLACRLMYDLEISNSDSHIRFGQLLGMQDPATYNLSQRGYNVLKCVAYGPTKEVIPFLLRRAQENSSALNGLSQDQRMLGAELVRRMRLFTEGFV